MRSAHAHSMVVSRHTPRKIHLEGSSSVHISTEVMKFRPVRFRRAWRGIVSIALAAHSQIFFQITSVTSVVATVARVGGEGKARISGEGGWRQVGEGWWQVLVGKVGGDNSLAARVGGEGWWRGR